MPTIVVNGVAHDIALEPQRSLLHFLREELNLTGAKLGCAEGAAGAGETPMITLAPAIANAIFAACGVRIRSLPLAPDGSIPGG